MEAVFGMGDEYTARCCERDDMRLPNGCVITKWKGAKRQNELHLLLKTVMVRRLKREVLSELPNKRRQRFAPDRAKLRHEKIQEMKPLLDKVYLDKESNVAGPNLAKIFADTAEAKLERGAEGETG